MPGSSAARETAFVEGHSRDDGDASLLAVRKQHIFGILVEDVVDDLHAVDQPRVERANNVGGLQRLTLPQLGPGPGFASRRMACQRSSDAHRSLQACSFCRSIVSTPRFSRLDSVCADVVRREDVVEGAVVELDQRWFLGGTFVAVPSLRSVHADRLGEQPLAVSAPLRPGRIEEVASEGDGLGQRFRCSSSEPVQPPSPHAVADFREFPTRSRILAIAHDCEGLRGQVPVRRGRSDASGRASVRPFRARPVRRRRARALALFELRWDLHWTRCNRTFARPICLDDDGPTGELLLPAGG